MPRGGRRPGAGAPRGNTNGLRSGLRSPRVQIVLAALLSNAEIRDILLRLRAMDDTARDEIRQIILASTRLLFDHPVNEQVREMAERAANDYLSRLPPHSAARAVRRYKEQLGFADYLPAPHRPSRSRLNDPAFMAFARELLGLPTPLSAGGEGPGVRSNPINPSGLIDVQIESEPPDLHDAIASAITQSNAEQARLPSPPAERGRG